MSGKEITEEEIIKYIEFLKKAESMHLDTLTDRGNLLGLSETQSVSALIQIATEIVSAKKALELYRGK